MTTDGLLGALRHKIYLKFKVMVSLQSWFLYGDYYKFSDIILFYNLISNNINSHKAMFFK